MIEGVNAFLNPYLYLIKDKSPKWETRKIQYGLRAILVTIRAFEVDYDKEEIEKVKFPWYAYKSAKYEVKDNPYGIKEIWYIKNKGWFVVVIRWNCGECCNSVLK